MFLSSDFCPLITVPLVTGNWNLVSDDVQAADAS